MNRSFGPGATTPRRPPVPGVQVLAFVHDDVVVAGYLLAHHRVGHDLRGVGCEQIEDGLALRVGAAFELFDHCPHHGALHPVEPHPPPGALDLQIRGAGVLGQGEYDSAVLPARKPGLSTATRSAGGLLARAASSHSVVCSRSPRSLPGLAVHGRYDESRSCWAGRSSGACEVPLRDQRPSEKPAGQVALDLARNLLAEGVPFELIEELKKGVDRIFPHLHALLA